MAVTTRIRTILTLDGAQFSRGMRGAQRDAEQFRQGVNEQMKKAGIAIGAAAGASVAIGARFEDAMNKVRSISHRSEADYKRLEDKARELGRATASTATESAEAMLVLAQAGADVNQILDATPAVLTGAHAGFTDMVLVAELVAQSLKRFNLPWSAALEIVNATHAASSRTMTNFERMAESMKFAGTVAGPFGLSFHETAAAVAILTDRLGDSSMAGTGFRRVLAGLVDPSNKIRLQVHGLAALDEDFAKSLERIEEASIPVENFVDWFGQRGGPAMLSLLAAGSGEYANLVQEITGTTSATDAYRKMMDGVIAQGKIVISALQDVAIGWFKTYGDKLKRLLTAAAATITNNSAVIIGRLRGITDAFVVMITTAFGFLRFLREHATAVRALAQTYGVLAVAIYGIATAQRVWNILMKANPVILALTVIATLLGTTAAAVGGWRRLWILTVEQVQLALNNLTLAWKLFAAGASMFWDALQRVGQQLVDKFVAVGAVLKRIMELLAFAGASIWEFFLNPFAAKALLEDVKSEFVQGLVDIAKIGAEAAGGEDVWKGYREGHAATFETIRREHNEAMVAILVATKQKLDAVGQAVKATNETLAADLDAIWKELYEKLALLDEQRAEESGRKTQEEKDRWKDFQDDLVSVYRSGWSSIIDQTRTGSEKIEAIWRGLFESIWNMIGETIARWIKMKLIMKGAKLGLDALTGGATTPFGFPTGNGTIALQSGGYVPGSPGQAVPAILHGGEFVQSRSRVLDQGSGGMHERVVVQIHAPVHIAPGSVIFTEDESTLMRFGDKLSRVLTEKVNKTFRSSLVEDA